MSEFFSCYLQRRCEGQSIRIHRNTCSACFVTILHGGKKEHTEGTSYKVVLHSLSRSYLQVIGMINTIKLFTLSTYSCPILFCGLLEIKELFGRLSLGFELKFITLLPYIDKLELSFKTFTNMLTRV